MNNCPNCGNAINGGETFCGSCGYNLAQSDNGMNQNNIPQPMNNVQQQPNNVAIDQSKTNGKAIAGFCFSLGGLLLFAILCIPGIVLSKKAKEEIETNGGKGLGLAKAGIIIGWIDAAFWILNIILTIAGLMD